MRRRSKQAPATASGPRLPRPARGPRLARGRLGPASLAILLVAGLCACAADDRLGGALASRAGAGQACPGARVCPYLGVRFISRRGSGVLRTPEAIAVANGPGPARVYVADQFGHSIQVFSAAGRFEGEWGSFGSGPGQLGAVGGLAVDSHGYVYAVDSTHARVERFTPSGAFVGQWGTQGSGVGQFQFGGGRGPDMPPGGGIAVSGSHVYVADTQNNRIERFSLDGTEARVLVGAGTAPGEVLSPRGLAATSAALYVTDDGSDRVQELTLGGEPLAQTSRLPLLPETFANPFSVAVHGDHVYVADDNNGRIVELSRSLRYQASFGGEGSYRLSMFVRAVAVDGSGRVYVADASHDRVEAFGANGVPLHKWGTSGDGVAQLVAPLDVASAPDGRLLVVQTFGSRSPLDLYSEGLERLASWLRGGGAILGRHWFSPAAAAFAPDGTVWVSDVANGLVRHLTAAGAFLGALGSSGEGTSARSARSGASRALSEPNGVAVASDGEVFVADTGHDRIEAFAASGAPRGSLTRGGALRLRSPMAVAIDEQGNVYVADTGHDRVVELDRRGQVLASWGGRGTGGGRFEQPAGIAIDAAGHVFVSDVASDRIQEFAAHGRFIASWGAAGTGPGRLSGPRGMTVDCHGDLLVADTHNNRIEVFAGAASPTGCPGRLVARSPRRATPPRSSFWRLGLG